MSYKVKTGEFEGPLDLLLSLIEDQKLDITRVSLAVIADDYLSYVKAQENIDLAHLTDFLSVAAKLILIKSKALLPLLELDEEEESDIRELERQLAALQAVKDVIPDFQSAFHHAQPLYGRGSTWGITVQFTPAPNMTAESLKNAFTQSLHAIPQLDALEEKIISDVVSLEHRIIQVQNMVEKRAQVAFSQVMQESRDVQEVVVSFLALLELVKQRILYAEQGSRFQDIIMSKRDAQEISSS